MFYGALDFLQLTPAHTRNLKLQKQAPAALEIHAIIRLKRNEKTQVVSVLGFGLVSGR